jgi:hypothetical protein
MAASPQYSGRFARAWLVDLRAARSKMPPGTPPDATVAHWVVEAPWSSQVVHSYSLVLIHLQFNMSGAPVHRYLPDATHEVGLIAIHPMVERDNMLREPTDVNFWIYPEVFGAQLIEPSDEAAVRRVFRAVELICAGRLSPHPTHVRAWAELFGDNMLARASPARYDAGDEGGST